MRQEFLPFYFTFGQSHVHRVNGKTFDCDCVAVLHDVGYSEARKRFFELFGDKFHNQTPKPPDMSYYPRGLIEVESGHD